LRLFVALELSDADRAALAAWAAEAAGDDPALRLVGEDSLHVTLAFLGEIDDPEPLRSIVRAGSCEPGPLRSGAVLWLAPRRPHVLTVAVEGELAAVHDELWSGLEELGFTREQRAFRPHVTVARVRGRPATTALPDPPARAFSPAAVTLFRSRLGSGPARYEPLERRKVGAALS
jgi:2'-5' RNA ligase